MLFFLFFVLTEKLAHVVLDGEGSSGRVDGGVWPCSSFFTFFEGLICSFSPSFAWHTPSNCVRRRLLVWDPLATAVLRCGVRRVVTTHLSVFHMGPRVDDHTQFFWGCGWWWSEDVGESLLWGCFGVACVPHAPLPGAVFPEGNSCVGFPILFLFVFQLTSCFVVINMVSAFSSDCVADSHIKQNYMSAQMHHSGWLGFMCNNLSVFVWFLFGSS